MSETWFDEAVREEGVAEVEDVVIEPQEEVSHEEPVEQELPPEEPAAEQEQEQVVSQDRSIAENLKRAMQHERMQKQHLQDQLQEQIAQQKKLQQQYEEQLKKMQETSSRPAEERAPDPEEDPLGYTQWQNKQLAAQLQKQQEWIQKQEEQRAQSEQQQQQSRQQQEAMKMLVSKYREQVDEYSQDKTDFWDAYKHLQAQRASELKAIGYTDENQINEVMRQDEAMIVAKALQEGANPAQRIYELARVRGYTQAAPEPVASTTSQIEQMQRGQKLQGLSSGGEKISAKYTPDSVDAMSDAEFDKYWAKFEADGRRAG